MPGWIQCARRDIAAEVLGELSNLLFAQLFQVGKTRERPRVRKPGRPFVMLGGSKTDVVRSHIGRGGNNKVLPVAREGTP